VSRLSTATRIAIVIVAVGAVVALMLATGWADDRADPGSRGRVPIHMPTP
jgi:hypothetical protein